MASQEGHPVAIMALVAAKASINQPAIDGSPPIGVGAQQGHDEVVALLAHLGARLHRSDGRGFWLRYGPDERLNKGRGELAHEFWPRLVAECGDDGSEESLIKRRAMLKANKIYDPR